MKLQRIVGEDAVFPRGRGATSASLHQLYSRLQKVGMWAFYAGVPSSLGFGVGTVIFQLPIFYCMRTCADDGSAWFWQSLGPRQSGLCSVYGGSDL